MIFILFWIVIVDFVDEIIDNSCELVVEGVVIMVGVVVDVINYI